MPYTPTDWVDGITPVDASHMDKLEGGLATVASEAAAALAAHAAAADPHTGYATDADLTAHVAAADPHTGYQKETEKAAANGYASLDSGGKVPSAQLPAYPADQTAATVPSTATGDVVATNVQAAIAELAAEKQAISQRAVASGYADLDSGAKLPMARLYTNIAGGVPMLDAGGKVAAAQLPAPAAGGATEVYYGEWTGGVEITAAALLVSSGYFTVGAGAHIVEAFMPVANAPANSSELVIFQLTTSAGQWVLAELGMSYFASGNQNNTGPLFGTRRMTPGAGSHYFQLYAYVTGGATGEIHAGYDYHGIGVALAPAYLRVIKV